MLTDFDRDVLEAKGNASDLMYRFYGKRIRKNNAEKQMAGVRTHLNYILNNAENIPVREVGEMEETVVKSDGTVTTKRLLLLSEEESKDPKRLMELMGFDVLQWTLVSCKVRRNYWDVTMKLSSGADENGIKVEIPHKETNHAFECTISVKPLQNILTTSMVGTIFESLTSPVAFDYTAHKEPDKVMLELPIMDLHLGKLAWDDEVGENYNIKIAKKLFKKVIEDVLDRICRYDIRPEKIIFPIGQDFFHFDNSKTTTTAGTVMDSDTRWQKMFGDGVELMIWAVENLRKVAPVECMYIASNHDKVMSYCLTYTIAAWFRNCEDVAVDLSPAPRKYVKYGKNLIGYSHGSEESKRIEHIMQAENPKEWGNTVFREWHLGHLHSEEVKEVAGVIIRRMSSITSIDSWHKEKAYLAIRKAQALVWDKEKGKQLTIDVNVTAVQ